LAHASRASVGAVGAIAVHLAAGVARPIDTKRARAALSVVDALPTPTDARLAKAILAGITGSAHTRARAWALAFAIRTAAASSTLMIPGAKRNRGPATRAGIGAWGLQRLVRKIASIGRRSCIRIGRVSVWPRDHNSCIGLREKRWRIRTRIALANRHCWGRIRGRPGRRRARRSARRARRCRGCGTGRVFAIRAILGWYGDTGDKWRGESDKQDK
jgi:hypothetical protein